MTKQSQQGGDGSTNIQAGTVITYVGIDEKRAREICREVNLQLKREYTQEALEIANSRVSEFENNLVKKMELVDGALEAFANPAFQLLLANAQKAAAATERKEDYSLLSELLVHRFRKHGDRVTCAGINVAVEVVDKVSDEALLGLTVAHAIASFRPLEGGTLKGLDLLDQLFGKVRYNELPQGSEWLDHLDILNAVRINSFGSLKKLDQVYAEALNGYFAVGVERNSDAYNEALETLKKVHITKDALIKHELNENYVRLNVSNKQDLEAMYVQVSVPRNGGVVMTPVKLSEQQINALKTVYGLYSTDKASQDKVLGAFRLELDKRENLRVVRNWWDNIPISFNITSAGKVLAHANAQRCDPSLPPLN